MKTVGVVALALAGGVAAQNLTLIPSNIGSSCSSFLTTLNTDSSLSSCVGSLINATQSFSPTSDAKMDNSTINYTLATLCKATPGCSDSVVRGFLSQFYAACMNELTSAQNYNAQVRELYDVLYVVNPLKGAVCAINSANQDYCVNEIIAAERGSSPSSSAVSSASASASGSASGSASASAASASASATGRPANSTVLIAGLPSAFNPVAVAANNLYITISNSAASLTRRMLAGRQAQGGVAQSAFATIVTPNATTYRTTNLPFLFLQPDYTSAQLCTPCTREVMVSYIKWETAVPYALGLSASPILGGQLDLWNAINSTCGTAYVNAIMSQVGVLSSTGNSTSGALPTFNGNGAATTAIAGVAVVAGAMALFA